MSNEQKKADKIYESLKALDVMDLASKKAPAVKELDKLLKQIAAVDVTKGSERAKLTKHFDKVNEALLVISMIDKLLKEKDF